MHMVCLLTVERPTTQQRARGLQSVLSLLILQCPVQVGPDLYFHPPFLCQGADQGRAELRERHVNP